MVSASGRYILIFNGQVYNFKTVRAELEQRGHHFRGGSDTEVLLTAIDEWGLASAIQRFVGMFAFAVWDRQDRSLHLVRDRLGIKPLYYTWLDTTFVFGSERQVAGGAPAFHAEIDRDALALLLRHGYVPAPYSIYRGVQKLSPGSILTLRSRDDRDARRRSRSGPLARSSKRPSPTRLPAASRKRPPSSTNCCARRWRFARSPMFRSAPSCPVESIRRPSWR